MSKKRNHCSRDVIQQDTGAIEYSIRAKSMFRKEQKAPLSTNEAALSLCLYFCSFFSQMSLPPKVKDLFQPPRLRSSRDTSDERHASWLELFYDLVFVVAIAQLSLLLSHEYSFVGLFHFAALFVPVWWAWIGNTFYLSRFDADDVTDRLLTMGQMMFVASLAVHIPQGLGEHSVGFALSYVGVRALLIAQYVRAGRFLPEARPLTFRYSVGFSIAAALWILSTVVPPPFRFFLWAAGIAIDFLTPITAGTLHLKLPPHVAHLPERFGLFTIIVLGEAIVATVQGTTKQALQGYGVFIGAFGLVIAFALWWDYFNDVRAAEARPMQTREDSNSYQIWMYLHLPLTMAITAAAVGVKHILNLKPGEHLPGVEGLVFCVSMAICTVCLNTIFLHAPSIARNQYARRYLWPHHIVTALMLFCGLFAGRIAPVLLVAFMAILSVAQVLLAFRETPTSAKKH